MAQPAPAPAAARARAPASIGNVAVGFDILGQAFPVAFDTVTAHRVTETGVRLGAVSGLLASLPHETPRNTALRAADAVLSRSGAGFGAVLDIEKGVPLASGMGGSAASAVAGAVAVNALLETPLDREALLECAFEGERASTDPPTIDNVAASLYGGLVLARSDDPVRIVPLPVPADLVCLLVHPDIAIETRMARGVLSATVPLETAVLHSRHVALFMAGCMSGDLGLLRAGLKDVLIEPQRRHLVPVLGAAQAAALDAGAIGCSLSGSGPSIFAWAPADAAPAVEQALTAALREAALTHRLYRAPVDGSGAELIAGTDTPRVDLGRS